MHWVSVRSGPSVFFGFHFNFGKLGRRVIRIVGEPGSRVIGIIGEQGRRVVRLSVPVHILLFVVSAKYNQLLLLRKLILQPYCKICKPIDQTSWGFH